ncbi:LysE family translocator [Oceanobacter mangrovi]|uniref:LysE family translocator n=1 Tax=Oceanobacter mangrovi TaxID=2862510 RepID=UPI001C8ED7FE|nr:LysE family translocator [Oceanobacter mangrovi]
MLLENLLAFFLAAVLLALAPGPDLIYVVTQSALRGWRTGVTIALGLCSGLIGHAALVALGVASVLMASPLAMTVLKALGALYLLRLGWQALLAVWRGDLVDLTVAAQGPDSGAGAGVPLAGWSLYRRGVVMNLSNPKVFVFFLAFLPQFIEPSATGWWDSQTLQIVVLSGLFMLAALLVFSAMALLSDRLGSRLLQQPLAQQLVNTFAGLVFIGLALKLATTEFV